MGSAANFAVDVDATKVVSPVKLAHIVLRTNNFAAMNEFYRNFLGVRTRIEVPG